MFKEGAVPGRIDADTYPPEAEDFTSDATHLDTWVFDRVKALFKRAERNHTLSEQLRQDQNVFFLHLLGLDTTGHGFRPYSREYLYNIQVVDKGVKEITELVNKFYGDDQTAFVFTADHGMSDWGSHGDGHPDNTRTPLIVWGAGVAKPVKVTGGKAPGHEDGFSHDWGFDGIARHDVAQADVAALMAYLAGLEYPVNSVGELPLDFLASDPRGKASGMLANAQSILEMYRVKEAQKSRTRLRYVPFGPLGDSEHSVQTRTLQIQARMDQGQYQEAIAESKDLIRLGLDGLRYLQTYDWLFLRTLVTAGYLGWIVFAITTVIDVHVLHGQVQISRGTTSLVFFSSVFAALCALLYMQESAATYYGYAVFPIVFWEEVWARRKALAKAHEVLIGKDRSAGEYFGLSLRAIAYVGLLEALVQSYFHREIYTVCYVAAVFWPLLYGISFVRQNALLCLTWALSCLAMSGFTLLPAIKVESIQLISLGGALMLLVGLVYLFFEKSILTTQTAHKTGLAAPKADAFTRGILGAQVGLIALAMLVTRSSVASIQAKRGLPLGTQIVGWLVLVSSLTVPFLHGLRPNNHYIHRLVVVFLTFSPIFIILTISYEGLFYFAFCATLFTWVRMEHRVYQFTSGRSTTMKNGEATNGSVSGAATHGPPTSSQQYRPLTLADARISLFFLFLLQSAFFSTGNIASVSSFSLDAVYRLIPVFDPFSQGALLLLKLMIPFAVISANLGILNRRLGVTPSALFMLVMAISDIMTLNFFYMVRDEGSWLEIGTTISHFFIASLLCVFVAGLEFVSEVFIRGVTFEDVVAQVEKKMQ